MADYANREQAETALTGELEAMGQEALALTLRTLGDEPDAKKLDAAFWSALAALYSASLLSTLERVAVESAQQEFAEFGLTTGFDTVNSRALSWASQYVFELVKGINDTNKAQLQQYIADFFRTGQTQQQLAERIAQLFGQSRSLRIAVTEVTRAAVQGQLLAQDQLKRAGIETVALWNSSNDGKVCGLCAPLNGKKQGDGWQYPPPLHVGCRCFLTITPLKVGA